MDQRTTAVFICLYMGYMVITYIRKSVSFASPAMMSAENISKSQLGLILSSQMLGYTFGKVMGGVVVDIYSPHLTFTLTLLSAALTVFAFTAFNTVPMFTFCWFLNGLAQGPSWPACARLIKKLFPAHQFGTWWSVLSTSMNVSGTAGPIVSTFLLSVYSWRFTMNVAGTIAIAVAGASVFLLTDRSQGDAQLSSSGDHSRAQESSAVGGVSWRKGVRGLLGQPVFVATCFNYLLVSLVRGACCDWGQLYLIQEKHHSNLTGSSFTSSQELGGIVGSLAAGYVSDFLIAKKASYYNPRQLVIFFCTVVMSVSVFFFLSAVSKDSSTLLICVVGFCLGFGVYGAIALFGVVAMESAVEKLAGTAHSIVSLAACVGMVISGFPLSVVAREYSWHLTFTLVQLMAVVATILSVFSVLRPHPSKMAAHCD
ncbi:hypothetical protein ACOMHN_019497 [Nucella lapillus]